ncbi:MAG: DUF1365 domain-containing protein [Phycisphaerales bacterium]
MSGASADHHGSASGSAIYSGWVRHRRWTPAEHAFRYRVYQIMLDLDSLGTVFRGRWFWSTHGPALAWFRRRDHFGDPQRGLGECARDLVEERLGRRPVGPVRLLTNLRCFGFIINPVSFFYCYGADASGSDGPPVLEAIIAEVHNTPWNERHCYVLDARAAAAAAAATANANPTTEATSGEPADPVEMVEPAPDSGHARPRRPRRFAFDFPKQFHVSPFHPMEQQYAWRFTDPAERLVVHMENHDARGKVTDATSVMQRRPMTGRSLAATLIRHPFMTVGIVLAIYWQAFKLRLKGAVFHDHPRSTAEASA